MPFPQRVVPERTDIPDVFQDNAQNILQKSAVSNMVGLLEQLNKISIFASEVFEDILEDTNTKTKRISSIKQRISVIEQKIPQVEQRFIANSPSYFYDNPYSGKEWQRRDNLRGLLFRRDKCLKSVNRRRENGLPLPDLSALDRLSPNVECVKKFSDSNFFMNEWLDAEKKKMEEERQKRKERKKKRKKKKRIQKEKIQGIAKDVYDPVTGKKIKAQVREISTQSYKLTDSNQMVHESFESGAHGDHNKYGDRIGSSKISQMAGKKKQKKEVQKKQASKKPIAAHESVVSYAQIPEIDKASKKPPISTNIAISVSGSGPPPFQQPNPIKSSGPPPFQQPGGPPPIPQSGGPPPNPHQQRKLSPMEMILKSQQEAEKISASQKQSQSLKPKKPHPLMAGRSQALLSGIRTGAKLKKTAQVKREQPKDQRSVLMMALRKKGQTGLKHIEEAQKNVKKEEAVNNTIFAILNRRKFMADSDSDSDSGTDDSWNSSDDE